MTRGQLVAVAVARALVMAAPAALAGMVLAFLASPLTPFGPARRAVVDPGLRWDPLPLSAAAAVIVVTLVSWVALATWLHTLPQHRGHRGARPGLASAASTAAWTSPPVAVGLYLAMWPGRGAATVPVRTAVAGVVLGAAALAAMLTFSANLDRLLSDPVQRGWNWDVAVGDFVEADEAHRVETGLAANPDVAAFSAFTTGPVTGDGIEIVVAGVGTDHGLVSSPVLAGRHPRSATEIAMGAGTLDRLGKGIGDTVELAFGGGEPVRTRIVGQVLPPAVLDGAMDLDSGAVMTLSGAQRVVGDRSELFADTFLVRLSPGIERAAATRLADDLGASVLGPTSTDDLENLRRFQDLPQVLAVLVGLLGLATLAHAQVTAVRRRRRDLAVLKALGFTSGQLRGSVACQATTLTVIAVTTGLPLGVLIGRWSWLVVLDRLGTTTTALVPIAGMVVLALVLVGVANLVAAGPGRAAAKVPAAEILRSA